MPRPKILQETEKITIRLPRAFLEQIDYFVMAQLCSSRSEGVREAVRDYVFKNMKSVAEFLEVASKNREAARKALEAQQKYLRT